MPNVTLPEATNPPHPDWTESSKGRLVLTAVFAAAAFMVLAHLWTDGWWPTNHEGPAFAQRTLVYAEHLRRGDLLPIWTSADVSGYGSPMPLFYHRLFYLLAAPLYLLLGSAKTADMTVLLGMLVVGAWGSVRLTRALGAGPLAATASGLSLMAANYTTTLWLVRGALAELTAAMLLPWLLWYFVRAVQERRMPLGLGVVLALVWHSHSVMAFYAGIVLAATFVVLALAGAASWRTLDPRRAWRPVLVFVLLVAPFAAAMLVVGRGYDLTRFVSSTLHPSYQFVPFSWYFWDNHWPWGHTAAGLMMQIDTPALVLLALAGAVVVVGRQRLPARYADLATVLVPALFCLVLQMRWTEPFYLRVPGAVFIQFPWRLMGLLTPAVLAAGFAAADRALPHDKRLVALSAAAAWMLAGSGAFVPLTDGRLPVDPPSLLNVNFSGFREYEPVAAPNLDTLRAAIVTRWRDLGCTVDREGEGEERVSIHFDVRCERASAIALPIYASPYHRIAVSGQSRAQRCAAMSDAPSACGIAVPAGLSSVDVQVPTVWGLLR